MRTSIIFCFCICLVIFQSCEKSIVNDDPCSIHNTNNITFEICDGGFLVQDSIQDQIQVTGKYDAERGLMINQNSFHNFHYCSKELSPDSLYLMVSLQYALETNNFSIPTLELQFRYAESRSNLQAASDSTFIYKDNLVLFNQLSKNNWDTKSFSDEYECNQVLVVLPDNNVPWGDMHLGAFNNYGFYFDWENFRITAINYDSSLEQIEFSANFNVSMKVLSCGFAEFYYIKNAELTTTINSCHK